TRPYPGESRPQPAPAGRRRGTLVAIGAAAAAILAIAVVTIVMFPPGKTEANPDEAAATSQSPDETGSASSTSPSASASDTPSSKKPEPGGDGAQDPEGSGAEDDESEEKDELAAPSRPTKFGAWFAGSGTYEAKWEAPADDGGADIVSYVVGDCQGNNLAIVDSGTFGVSVQKDKLACMSVYAVNSQGMGTEAQHPIDNNP
ncbi:MAG: hypothetical protein ACRD0P_09060, partial [Stackebrandtia sp.]